MTLGNTPQKIDQKINPEKSMRNPDDLISMIRNSVVQFRNMRKRSEAGSEREGSEPEDGDSVESGEPEDKGESGKSSSGEGGDHGNSGQHDDASVDSNDDATIKTVLDESHVMPDKVNEVFAILGEDDLAGIEQKESMIDWDKIHKIEHEDGWIYAGRLDREGYFTGNGDLQYPNEPTAEYKKNMPIPQRYGGNFLKGQKYGKGIMTYTNRDVYNGIWEKDRKTGRGIYLGANGDRYIGEFSDG